MILPQLPKKIKQDEAKFGLKFRKWLDEHPMMSCTFEMKDTRGSTSLPFSEVGQEQRMHGLRTGSDKGNLIRIQTGTPGAPDYAYYRKAPAFIVIRYPKSFQIISVETFMHEEKRSKRRSLLESRAKEISILSVTNSR